MTKAVILIGSGPSLNRIDPRRLAGFDAITFNRAWLAWGDFGFVPRHHACLDPATMAILGPELPAVVAANPRTTFYLHSDAARHGVAAGGNVVLCDLVEGRRFADTLATLTDFGNVGAVSMQVLRLLGYGRVLMVGVDGDYATEQTIESDVNHFRDDYARGRVALTPALRQRYTAYWPAVAAECARCGIEVRNASPGTVLTCFEVIALEAGLRWLSDSDAVARATQPLQEAKS